ncbi:MAG: hypothetical protein ACMXYE_00575 [Candidatus Woesearchaeota archaeon]
MKPFYSIGYQDLVSSAFKLDYRFKRISILLSVLIPFTLLLGFVALQNQHFITLVLFFILGVVSMFPLRFAGWCGFFDMNIILTVYTAINFGLPAALFVGTASVFGILFSGDVDNNIIFDLIASYVIAIIASLFVMQFFVPVVIFVAVVYASIALSFHYLSGTLDFLNATWTITNLIWVLFFVLKLIPIFSSFSL